MKHTESKSQQALIGWFNVAYRGFGLKSPNLLYAIPNGGARNVVTGAILKREGVRAGVPDLCLAVSRVRPDSKGFYPSLYIEMKKLGGRTTEAQNTMLALLEEQGHKVVVCFSTTQAIKEITNYLKSE